MAYERGDIHEEHGKWWAEDDPAVWVSCPICDVLPGDYCVGTGLGDHDMHERRIEMAQLLAKES